jgi:DNA-binding response OmpR family regulator
VDRILVIEDEISIAELQRDYLELSGFAVDIRTTGQEGIHAFRQNVYQLVILDLMLPDMDGYEICKRLREYSDIPIIMVTAKNEDIDMIKGLDRGADDYVEKPFNPNKLVARVKAHIARYNRLASNDKTDLDEISLGRLKILLGARKVIVNRQEQFLTAKEFDLLVFLATHPNHVFTKDQLLQQVWGYDFGGDDNTVTVHIRRIREKIEQSPSKPEYIETIWGVGYRFNPN